MLFAVATSFQLDFKFIFIGFQSDFIFEKNVVRSGYQFSIGFYINIYRISIGFYIWKKCCSQWLPVFNWILYLYLSDFKRILYLNKMLFASFQSDFRAYGTVRAQIMLVPSEVGAFLKKTALGRQSATWQSQKAAFRLDEFVSDASARRRFDGCGPSGTSRGRVAESEDCAQRLPDPEQRARRWRRRNMGIRNWNKKISWFFFPATTCVSPSHRSSIFLLFFSSPPPC
jgi:hypothetical protein